MPDQRVAIIEPHTSARRQTKLRPRDPEQFWRYKPQIIQQRERIAELEARHG